MADENAAEPQAAQATGREAADQEFTVPPMQQSQRSNRRRANNNTVRANLYYSFGAMSRTSRAILLIQASFILAQITSGIVVLVLSQQAGEYCGNGIGNHVPIRDYVIAQVVFQLIWLPLIIYLRVLPPQTQRRRSSVMATQNSSGARLQMGDVGRQQSGVSAETASSSQGALNAANQQDLEQQQQQRHVPFPQRLKGMLEMVSIMIFLVGNWYILGSVKFQCVETAPMLWYMGLTYLIVGYLVLFSPIILILAIIFCLPFVLLFLRLFYYWTGVNLVAGLSDTGPAFHGTTQDVLSKIPIIKYAASVATPASQPPASADTTHSQSPRPIAEEDAHCTICLGDYVEGADLKRMPGCQHHFHSACVDEWLLLNKTCPFCREDVELEVGKLEATPD